MAPLFTGLRLGFGRSAAAEVVADPSAPAGITATGGTVTTAGGKTIHSFTSPGPSTFTVSAVTGTGLVAYLVVAGGGGGGSTGTSLAGGGGGGAGGLRTNLSGHPLAAPSYPVSPGPYTVTVGNGGAGAPGGGGPAPAPGTPGQNSEFYPTPASYPSTSRIRSVGGGGGGSGTGGPQGGTLYPGDPGGSGGGSGLGTPSAAHLGGTGNTADPNHPQRQGYDGGNNPGPYSHPVYPTGGGGGAGGAGQPGGSSPNPQSGHGGLGVQVLISGPPASPQPNGVPGPGGGTGWFAGGGGGARYASNGESGTGGAGPAGGGPYAGGGNGGPGPATPSGGTTNTGGGGGGAYDTPAPSGGSGIVIITYVT